MIQKCYIVFLKLYKCRHTQYILKTGLMKKLLNHIFFRCNII